MRHLTGQDRSQTLLLPESLDDYVGLENPVRFIRAFVDELDLAAAGFRRVRAKETGRPGYAPGDLLKLYIYGYLNRIRSSRGDFVGGRVVHDVSLSRLVWVASADATLVFADNGGVQTKSKTGETFWSFLACDGKPANLRSVLLAVRRGEVLTLRVNTIHNDMAMIATRCG